eukprot:1146873-Pelagomonas_calceolata.AAC.1
MRIEVCSKSASGANNFKGVLSMKLRIRLGDFLQKERKRKEKKNYVGRGNSPYINQGKGDTLAQKSLEPPPSTKLQKEESNGDLEGYWKHPAP